MKVPKGFKKVNRGKVRKTDFVKHQKFGVYRGILVDYTIKECNEIGYVVYRKVKGKIK